MNQVSMCCGHHPDPAQHQQSLPLWPGVEVGVLRAAYRIKLRLGCCRGKTLNRAGLKAEACCLVEDRSNTWPRMIFSRVSLQILNLEVCHDVYQSCS